MLEIILLIALSGNLDQKLDLHTGDRCVVKLATRITTGYAWYCEDIDGNYEDVSTNTDPEFSGSKGYDVFVIPTDKPIKKDFVFVYKRISEKDQSSPRKFTLHLEVEKR